MNKEKYIEGLRAAEYILVKEFEGEYSLWISNLTGQKVRIYNTGHVWYFDKSYAEYILLDFLVD